jgi:Hydroxymethylglutaryl-coenzyme A synthase C terminal
VCVRSLIYVCTGMHVCASYVCVCGCDGSGGAGNEVVCGCTGAYWKPLCTPVMQRRQILISLSLSICAVLIQPQADLTSVCNPAEIRTRLRARVAVAPALFEEAMNGREQFWAHCCAGTPEQAQLSPTTAVDLDPATTYLECIDQRYRRTYRTTPA